MDPITIGTSIGTTLITNFATKGESAPIQTLNDIWYLAFGKLHLFTEKKRAKHATDLASYKDEIAKNVLAIPEENLIEPPLSIVGPALEASKFYIEEVELRKMFANIISSSMDNRKSPFVHHAFVEIIKQLSPLDAENISLFKNKSRQPIVNTGVKNDRAIRRHCYRNVFLNNTNCEDIELIASSLTNIQRLGLLEITYQFPMLDTDIYHAFENHFTFIEMTEEANFINEKYKDVPELHEMLGMKPWLERGIIQLTPLGEIFIKVCL